MQHASNLWHHCCDKKLSILVQVSTSDNYKIERLSWSLYLLSKLIDPTHPPTTKAFSQSADLPSSFTIKAESLNSNNWFWPSLWQKNAIRAESSRLKAHFCTLESNWGTSSIVIEEMHRFSVWWMALSTLCMHIWGIPLLNIIYFL